ncbi:MAG: TMEM175 family protein [Acidobacteriota bacterium]
MYSKHRLEALSDGIFAIAMTLLVLDIKIPEHVPHGQLAHALATAGPDWVAFLITFGLAARYWTLQHQLFDLLEHVKPRTLLLNFIFLALVAVLPFTTALWGHAINEPLAFCLYFGHQGLIGIAILLEIEFGLREHNLRDVEDMHRLRGRLYTMVIAMIAASISAWLLPLRYTGIVAALLAGISRRVRKFLAHRRAKQRGHLAPAKSGGA